MVQTSVLAIGVFDLFHIGHLRYLQYARAQASYLMVAVAPDAMVQRMKHKLPLFTEQQRLEIVQALGWVEQAKLLPCSTEFTDAAAAWICAWAVQKVVVGGEWRGSARWARLTPLLAQQGIAVEFAPHTAGISTSEIIQRVRSQTQDAKPNRCGT